MDIFNNGYIQAQSHSLCVVGVHHLEGREAHLAFETDNLQDVALFEGSMAEMLSKLRNSEKDDGVVVVYKDFHVHEVRG